MGGAAGEHPRGVAAVYGSGPAVLLLHGWGVHSDLWDLVLDGLEQGRKLIVPNLPGFGVTPEPAVSWSVHDYADWCIALLDRLGVETCDIVGHSNGGRIGIVMAAEHPDRIRRMVLTASAGIRPRRTLRDVARVRTYKALRAVERSSIALPARCAAARGAEPTGAVPPTIGLPPGRCEGPSSESSTRISGPCFRRCACPFS